MSQLSKAMVDAQMDANRRFEASEYEVQRLTDRLMNAENKVMHLENEHAQVTNRLVHFC